MVIEISKQIPDFYAQLDTLKDWFKDGNKYSYDVIWGNGEPTPKGEREDYDGTFSISIEKGKKEFHISCGSW